jgi:hypothetical protein
MGNLDGGSVDAADFEGRDGTIDLARPLAAQNERGGGRREEGNRSADPEGPLGGAPSQAGTSGLCPGSRRAANFSRVRDGCIFEIGGHSRARATTGDRRRGMAENGWQRPRAPALSARALAYGSTQAMGRAANLFR